MKRDDIVAERRVAQGAVLFFGIILAACGGSGGGHDEAPARIADTPSLADASSPAVASTAKTVTGYFHDDARNFEIEVNFSPDRPAAGADEVLFTGDDNVVSYTAARLHLTPARGSTDTTFTDPDALPIRFVAPGPDGLWFTADDIALPYSKVTTDLQSVDTWIGRTINYGGAGPDGIWLTTDDDVANYIKSSGITTDGGHGTNITYSGPGSDGIWFTNDDAISRYDRYDNTSDDHTISFRGAGPDGKWFTPDDTVEQSARTRNGEFILSFAGDDGMLDTADDRVCYTELWSIDHPNDFDQISSESGANGCPRFTLGQPDWYNTPPTPYRTTSTRTSKTDYVVYSSAGPDGQWRTADDVIAARIVTTPPAGAIEFARSPSRFIYYDGPGADRRWFTDDDHIARTGVANDPNWLFSSANTLSSAIQFKGPGADQNWSTPDDVVLSAERTVVGLFGGWDIEEISYTNNGPDRLLGTADDTVSKYLASTCKSAEDAVAAIEIFQFNGAGPDALWFTPDDVATAHQLQYVRYDSNDASIAKFCTP